MMSQNNFFFLSHALPNSVYYCTNLTRSLESEPGGSGGTSPDPCTRHLLTNLDRIDSSQLQSTHAVVQGALALLRPGPGSALSHLSGVRRVGATLLQPVENLETPVKMAAGLTAGIRVLAIVDNLVDVRTLRIQVAVYPRITSVTFSISSIYLRN